MGEHCSPVNFPYRVENPDLAQFFAKIAAFFRKLKSAISLW
jgi:hypothetical protein